MDKATAEQLRQEAAEVARRFSSARRLHNITAERFEVDEIVPLSAEAACVIFKKDTGKKAVAHFIHVRRPAEPYWTYYFLGAAHLINLDKIPDIYWEVEKHNYPLNFPEVTLGGEE